MSEQCFVCGAPLLPEGECPNGCGMDEIRIEIIGWVLKGTPISTHLPFLQQSTSVNVTGNELQVVQQQMNSASQAKFPNCPRCAYTACQGAVCPAHPDHLQQYTNSPDFAGLFLVRTLKLIEELYIKYGHGIQLDYTPLIAIDFSKVSVGEIIKELARREKMGLL